VAVSQLAYPGGSERFGNPFTSRLVVVNKNDVPGALAGAVLARANSSPLLVTDGSSLTNHQKDEIKRLSPTGMFVIGDTKAVPEKLVNAIKAAGVITTVSTGPTTTVATTVAPPTTVAGAPVTTTTLPTPTAERANVVRLTGTTPADIAKAVAGALDVRSDQEKSTAVPAFAGAVVVNAASKESAAGLAFAASLRAQLAERVQERLVRLTWVQRLMALRALLREGRI
jgi:hypothetical protein